MLVSAEGFELVEGEWRNNLVVSPEDPYPTRRLLLQAHNPPQPGIRLIHALYASGGKTIGLAARFVRVLGRDEPEPPVAPPQFTNTELPLGITSPSPDLEIRILSSGEVDGRLSWSLLTPHGSVTVPNEPLFTDIGRRPDAFAREIMSGIPERNGEPDLMAYLRGVGTTVRDRMPLPLWDVLRGVSKVVGPGRRPTVLLLSGEPYVPWELALVSDPVFPDAPPFLATQANVGRWMLLPHNRHFPPPASARPRPFVALWAMYAGSLHELPGAREEARELARRFGAREVQATLENAVRTLTDGPGAHMLHFAGHGGAGNLGAREGLLMDDDRPLVPLSITGLDLHSPPLVFLNACQVGAGNESLGAYSGTAAAFVAAGASAVVAPLWSIDDREAPKIAVEFYDRVLSGEPPAAVITDLRASFSSEDAVDRLAYQFFGHPLLVVDT